MRFEQSFRTGVTLSCSITLQVSITARAYEFWKLIETRAQMCRDLRAKRKLHASILALSNRVLIAHLAHNCMRAASNASQFRCMLLSQIRKRDVRIWRICCTRKFRPTPITGFLKIYSSLVPGLHRCFLPITRTYGLDRISLRLNSRYDHKH